MTNVFRTVTGRLKDSPIIILVMAFSTVAVFISIGLYYEDYISSSEGLKLLDTMFGIVPASSVLTYYLLSATPQIGSTVFGYIYLSDTSQKWAIRLAMGMEAADFIADLWYRTANGNIIWQFVDYVFYGKGDGGMASAALFFSLMITAIYSWLGIVMLASAAGVLFEGFTPAVVQFAKAWRELRVAINEAKRAINQTSNPTTMRQNQPRQNNNQAGQVERPQTWQEPTTPRRGN